MSETSLHPWLAFDAERAQRVVEGFLQDYLERAGAEGYTLGISGGLDSATTAALAIDALGPAMVECVTMPGPTSSDEDARFAREVADALGTDLVEVSIAEATDALGDALAVEVDRVTRGNVQARLRMTVLYAHAKAENRLVLGTGNKSELLTGYFTKHGDGGVDVLPVGDLYKTQVRRVAEALPVPEEVRTRPPTAGLWRGQRDEEELGLPYAALDVVLAGIETQRETRRIAEEAGVESATVERIRGMVKRTWHKRNPPPVPKLGWRTVGVDWREPTAP